MMSFTTIIPARFASSRLPKKVLLDIAGKPMLQHVFERAIQSATNRVIVATDHEEIKRIASNFGAEVCMTAIEHESGTERLAEVIDCYGIADDEIIVNLQADEPQIPINFLNDVAFALKKNTQCEMATLAVPIQLHSELSDPNIVKVVLNANSEALYFSRASIPWNRDDPTLQKKIEKNPMLRHIGLYAYRAAFLKEYIKWPACPLEHIEKLEQLRVLWYGKKIHVVVSESVPPRGVDSQEDLDFIRSQF